MNSAFRQNVTSIATLLTAAAAFLTALEMRRQRTASYRPALAIGDQPVKLYRPAQADYGRTIVFQPTDTLPSREALPGGDVRFQVRNVGAGPALQAEAHWEFDAVEFAAVVANADADAGQGISVERDFVRFEAPGYGSWAARQAQLHYLGTLPSLSDVAPVDVPIPFAYASLASALFQAVLANGLDHALQLVFPPLTLRISYCDRSGSRLESRYKIRFELIFLLEGGEPLPESPGWNHIGEGVFTAREA